MANASWFRETRRCIGTLQEQSVYEECKSWFQCPGMTPDVLGSYQNAQSWPEAWGCLELLNVKQLSESRSGLKVPAPPDVSGGYSYGSLSVTESSDQMVAFRQHLFQWFNFPNKELGIEKVRNMPLLHSLGPTSISKFLPGSVPFWLPADGLSVIGVHLNIILSWKQKRSPCTEMLRSRAAGRSGQIWAPGGKPCEEPPVTNISSVVLTFQD